MTKVFQRREAESSQRHPDPHLYEPFSKDEIRHTLRKMANGKVEGLDRVPVEVFGGRGVRVDNRALQCYFSDC